MKKLILFVFATIAILNTSAFAAFPSVGDSATYDVQQEISGQTIKGEMTSTITAISADEETATVMTTVNGVSQGTQEKSVDELQGLYMLVDQCSDVQGTIETVTTASRPIRSCLLHQELNNESGPVTGDIWFGKIPFGIVKSVVKQTSSTGSMTQTMILKSYKPL